MLKCLLSLFILKKMIYLNFWLYNCLWIDFKSLWFELKRIQYNLNDFPNFLQQTGLKTSWYQKALLLMSLLPFLQIYSPGLKRMGLSLRTSSQRNPASVFWNISTLLSVLRWTWIAISPFNLSKYNVWIMLMYQWRKQILEYLLEAGLLKLY